ncbi:NAD(P)-binding protein [Brucella sp. BE17]|uniref:NAD(P)/FAD-dependent oxidoreductase n=1 Tax=Brucella sp. BE17 TaxID=3142977 RepID=UPI0031BAB4EB
MANRDRARIAIVGAGPVALYAVFQLGLFGFRCHVFDTLDQAGGQCRVLYPDKPIYDIPGFPSIMAEEIVDRLLKQIAPYEPVFHFSHVVRSLERAEKQLVISTDRDFSFKADAVVIASGLGALEQDGQIKRPDPLIGLALERVGNAICVAPDSFATTQVGVYAIGDACHYPGKLKLIVSGFHEAALMTQAMRKKA